MIVLLTLSTMNWCKRHINWRRKYCSATTIEHSRMQHYRNISEQNRLIQLWLQGHSVTCRVGPKQKECKGDKKNKKKKGDLLESAVTKMALPVVSVPEINVNIPFAIITDVSTQWLYEIAKASFQRKTTSAGWTRYRCSSHWTRALATRKLIWDAKMLPRSRLLLIAVCLNPQKWGLYGRKPLSWFNRPKFLLWPRSNGN